MTTKLPKLQGSEERENKNCGNQVAENLGRNLINFLLNSTVLIKFLPQVFSNLIATILSLSLSVSLSLSLSFLFFPPIFDNLVVTILIISLLTPLQFRRLGCHNWFPFRALHPALRAFILAGKGLGNRNFGNEIIDIQNFFSLLPSHHLSFLSHTFVRILATLLPKFTLFPQFSK